MPHGTDISAGSNSCQGLYLRFDRFFSLTYCKPTKFGLVMKVGTFCHVLQIVFSKPSSLPAVFTSLVLRHIQYLVLAEADLPLILVLLVVISLSRLHDS